MIDTKATIASVEFVERADLRSTSVFSLDAVLGGTVIARATARQIGEKNQASLSSLLINESYADNGVEIRMVYALDEQLRKHNMLPLVSGTYSSSVLCQDREYRAWQQLYEAGVARLVEDDHVHSFEIVR